ncbi:hypothetical protein A8B79_06305 [Balneola sp. EhC07]|uniref:hypothetical protein n=1 Tax=Balneola sp. EhC07 TaxID=1849360 RepID=UPI0007F3F0A5|nr:hypothetical protein [Balneola sp. EhC07]OAN61081.1 hypothetical protein A8B79_06305 [Balneola sp. EhC07]
MNKETQQKSPVQRTLSIVLITVGLMLMIFMITVEDEPGAIPLFMILSGIVWFYKTRLRNKMKPS